MIINEFYSDVERDIVSLYDELRDYVYKGELSYSHEFLAYVSRAVVRSQVLELAEDLTSPHPRHADVNPLIAPEELTDA